MAWLSEEFILAITGVLFGLVAALGFMPRVSLGGRARGAYGLLSVGFLAVAAVLAVIDGVAYPPFLWALPILPIVIGIVIVRDREADTGDHARAPAAGVRFVRNPVHGTAVHDTADPALRCLASNPRTSPAELARIAYAHPEVREVIARNPATPANLLEWLAAVGDEAVVEAIAARPHAIG